MTDVLNHRPARSYWPWLVSAALAVALYAHTLAGTWVYDDVFHARNDPRLADAGRWGEYWKEGYYPAGVDNLWRPLVSMSYAAQWKLSGDRAWPFHLVNVLLHAAASGLVAELARRLTRSGRVAVAAGVLFAAHPLHVEAVAYIVGRAETACAVGVLGALVLALRPLTWGRAVAIFGCMAGAILSKEQGLLLPLMLAALWPLRRRVAPEIEEARAAERPAARLLLILTLFGVAGYLGYREHILPFGWDARNLDYATQPLARAGAADRAMIPFALLGRAVGLAVAPVRLSPEYGEAVITARQSLADPYLYVGALAASGLIALGIGAALRRAGVAGFLLVCGALSYGMVANVLLIGVVFAERLLYLPSAFAIIGVAVALAKLPRRGLTIVVVSWAAALSVRTVTYAARWNDRLSFYEQSVAERPEAVRLRVLLVGELLKRNELERAARVNEVALAVAPGYWKVWADAARVAAAQGRAGDARAYLGRAWRLGGDPLDLMGVEKEVNAARARAVDGREWQAAPGVVAPRGRHSTSGGFKGQTSCS